MTELLSLVRMNHIIPHLIYKKPQYVLKSPNFKRANNKEKLKLLNNYLCLKLREKY